MERSALGTIGLGLTAGDVVSRTKFTQQFKQVVDSKIEAMTEWNLRMMVFLRRSSEFVPSPFTLLRLALPKLFDDKERNVDRLNPKLYQTLHKSESFTVNKPKVFQIKGESQS